MGVKDSKYIENGVEFRKVPLMDGRFGTIETKALAGICHHPAHNGYLSITLLQKHDCICKQCHYLERLEDYPFWEKLRNREAEKQKKKEKIRQERQEEKCRQEKMDRKMETFKIAAQEIADKLHFPIYITRVALLREVQETRYRTSCEYVVNFTSDGNNTDYRLFFPLAQQMRKRFGGKYFLRPNRDADGKYITTAEWMAMFTKKRES